MGKDLIRYDILTQEALRAMIARLLDEVARAGLPGDHHFFITFDTRVQGVRLSSRMREKYPEEMTIVVQHRFWDMEVSPDRFQIGLSFDEIPEILVIPMAAIRGFYDPSVKFGLQFETQDVVEKTGGKKAKTSSETSSVKVKKEQPGRRGASSLEDVCMNGSGDVEQTDKVESGDGSDGAQIVSLDSFRKKK